MDPITVITGTVTITDTSVIAYRLNLVVPLIPNEMYAWWLSLFFGWLVFVLATRFQMWALLFVLIESVMYLPFALTGFAPYAAFSLLFFLVAVMVLHFVTAMFAGKAKVR